MEIMVTATTLAAKTMPVLLPVIAFRQIQLSLRRGNHAFSAFGYAFYGLILCGITGEIDLGYRFGELAHGMLDRLEQRDQRAAVRYIVNATIRHWRDHIYDTLQPVRDVAENGEIEYLGIAAGLYSYHSYFISHAKIANSERAILEASDLLNQVPEASVRYRYEMGRQFYLNLLGRAENPCELQGEAYDEKSRLQLHVEANDRTTVYYLACHKLILCYLFGDHEQGLNAAELAAKHSDGGIGTPLVPVLNFYDSLTRLALYPTASRAEQRQLLKQVTANQARLRRWAHYGPANCQHKVTLVDAERARVAGRSDLARGLYEQAITQAHRQGYLPEEALAQELAGRFYVSLGLISEGRSHLRRAHMAYDEWGAKGKCRHVETQYPGFWPEATEGRTVETDVQASLAKMLDLTSILEAADAISRRTVLPKLLENLTTVMTKTAGAQRGYLLMEKKGEWAVEAACTPEGPGEADALVGESSAARLLLAAVSQAAHTRTRVLVTDAGRMREVPDDLLLMEQHPKSILCLPLVNRGELMGIFYLENTLTSDAFRPDRLELLDTLAIQAAISVQNARLYAELQQKESLERELRTARDIQRSFLPRNVPALEGFQFGVIQEPARTVGGDLYDFMALDRDTLGIVVADVADKGIPAALGMALTRSLLRAEASRRGQPAAVLRTVNLHLLEISDSEMFVTVLYGKLNCRTREFTYVRAGHELPILLNAAGEREHVPVAPGQPLGIFLDPLLDEGTLTIPEGGKLILTTDGVTDAVNQADEPFGEERFMQAIRDGWHLPAQELCDRILAAVTEYQGDSPRFDDFTLMVVQAE
jgi:serine phosphatase RsbU (regulator of sigma subunit)